MRGYWLENKNSTIDKKSRNTKSDIIITQYLLFSNKSLQNNTQ